MTNIKLSDRLQTIADMVKKGSRIIDVGCDHAFLDIYLVKNNIVKKAIASDITKGAINQAIKNVNDYNLEDKIDIRLGDGLSTLKNKDKVDTVIISGMGDKTIINILNNYNLEGINNLIIQSNLGIVNIRKQIVKLGYKIIDEKIVVEKDKHYIIISFEKGRVKYKNKEYYFGPILLKNKDSLFKKYYSKKLRKYLNIFVHLPKRNFIEKIKILYIINKIKKEIK